MPVSFPNRYGAVSRVSVRRQELSHGFGAGMGGRKPMLSSHAHGDLELNFAFQGSVRYRTEDREIDVPCGSLKASESKSVSLSWAST